MFFLILKVKNITVDKIRIDQKSKTEMENTVIKFNIIKVLPCPIVIRGNICKSVYMFTNLRGKLSYKFADNVSTRSVILFKVALQRDCLETMDEKHVILISTMYLL